MEQFQRLPCAPTRVYLVDTWFHLPVCSEEHVDVSGLELSVVRGQRLDQPLDGAGLHEAYSNRLPLQVGDLIIWFLEIKNFLLDTSLILLTLPLHCVPQSF